jgi:hypothetical protein
MADVSEVITLGIGTPSSIPYFLTVGLGQAVVPPTPVAAHGGLLYLGITKTILSAGAADFTTDAYILPSRCTRYAVQIAGTGLDVDIEGTLDLKNFAVLTNLTSAGDFTYQNNIMAIRFVLKTTSAAVDIFLTPKREKF